MRQLTFSLFICLAIGCATTKSTNVNSGILNGTWVPISEELGGVTLPKAAFEL